MSINKQLLHEKCLSCVSLNLLRDLDKNYFYYIVIDTLLYLHIQINFKPHYCSKMLLCMDIKLIIKNNYITVTLVTRYILQLNFTHTLQVSVHKIHFQKFHVSCKFHLLQARTQLVQWRVNLFPPCCLKMLS